MDETRALTGLSVEPPEIDIDDIEDPIVEASDTYDELCLINSMGTKEFELIFPYVSDIVKSLDKFEKMSFFKEFINKFNSLYETDYDITGNETVEELRDIIDMVMFCEFNYIDFFSNIWKEFTPNLMRIKPTIFDFCINNKKQIILLIENQVQSIQSPHIRQFLINYNGDLLIKWFSEKTENKKIEITLNILNGGN